MIHRQDLEKFLKIAQVRSRNIAVPFSWPLEEDSIHVFALSLACNPQREIYAVGLCSPGEKELEDGALISCIYPVMVLTVKRMQNSMQLVTIIWSIS